MGKTQSLRLIRRLPESGSPEQCASRWALTYTKPLELRVAEVERLEDGGAVVVFLADLRLADELGFNYSRWVYHALKYAFWSEALALECGPGRRRGPSPRPRDTANMHLNS